MTGVFTEKSKNTCKNIPFNHTTSQKNDYKDLYQLKTVTGNSSLYLYRADDNTPFRFTGKERDAETGLNYYGARYLDPKVSLWLSTDPAMGEYIPSAHVNDEARKRNGNLIMHLMILNKK